MNHLKRMKVKKIDAAGGVVYRFGSVEPEVLLIFRNGVWDIPKGKKEKGETNRECARREVMEEVNASELPEVTGELVTTKHSYTEKNKKILKTTYWYSMRFNSEQDFKPQTKEGISEVKWVALKSSLKMVGFDNLKDVLKDFQRKLES